MTSLKKNKKTEKINEPKTGYLKRFNKMGKPLIKLILKIKGTNSKIRNQKRECNHRYTRDFNNFMLINLKTHKMTFSRKKYQFPK